MSAICFLCVSGWFFSFHNKIRGWKRREYLVDFDPTLWCSVCLLVSIAFTGRLETVFREELHMVRIKLVEIEMSSEPVDGDYQKYCQDHAQHAREQQGAWKYQQVKRNFSDLEISSVQPEVREPRFLSSIKPTSFPRLLRAVH